MSSIVCMPINFRGRDQIAVSLREDGTLGQDSCCCESSPQTLEEEVALLQTVASSVFFPKEDNSDEIAALHPKQSRRHKHSRSEHFTAPLAENITTPQQILLFQHRTLTATLLRQFFGVRSMNCRFVCSMLRKSNHIADFASRDVNAIEHCASIQTQGMHIGVATDVRRECS